MTSSTLSSAHKMIEEWLAGPRDIQFYTRTYVPSSGSPRAVITFVHGFQEHIARYSHFHPELADRGIAVWAFDQAGFGRTALDKEKRSKKSAWGRTGSSDQMQDVDWAVRTASKDFPGVPVFLMGHSMGGAEVLNFVTQQSYSTPQYAESVASLEGVIATSPLIQQTTPASKFARWLGGKAASIAPYTLIAASVDSKHLSHSPEFNEAYTKDPLIKPTGSLRCVGEMLTEGEKLLSDGCHHWPKQLPVLLIHGDADKVTSIKATQTFCAQIDAEDKTMIVFPDGYHELQNELPEVRQKLIDDIVSFVDAHTIADSASSIYVPISSNAPVLPIPDTDPLLESPVLSADQALEEEEEQDEGSKLTTKL